MRTTIDKAGRVVIPGPVREQVGFRPGTDLEVLIENHSVRLVRAVPGPTLVRVGKRLVARPSVGKKAIPRVNVAALVEEERSRWPW
jgi:AbrB family looped-hinge helix DNA binding protein